MNTLQFNYDELLPETPDGFWKFPVQEFMEASSMPDKGELWYENYMENRKDMKPVGVQPGHENDTAVLIGASPAIKKNLTELKNVNGGFLTISSNASLKLLLENDIKPDYVFACEGGNHIARHFDCDTSDLTLIASSYCAPEAVKKWQGEKQFYILRGTGNKYQEQIKRDWPNREPDMGGGNVINTAFLWLRHYLGISHFIIIGSSLCMYDEYYHDGRKKEENLDEWENIWTMDIYGNSVRTTPSLLMYKTWLEMYSQYCPDASFINATEDGILGIVPELCREEEATSLVEGQWLRPRYLPWWNIVPLKVAIDGHKRRIKDNGKR